MGCRGVLGRAGVVAGVAIGMVMGAGAGMMARAEICTTQSQMKAEDRDSLASAARAMVGRMQGGDAAGLQAESVAELAKNFNDAKQAVLETSAHLRGDTLMVQEVDLLDATGLAAGADAQFFCSLNKSPAEVDFSISGLTSGVYGFALVEATGATPWRVSLLLRREGGRWLLAGFFPGPVEAAGHDGLWYWKEARRLHAAKQPWNAWLLYGEAQQLLQPAGFVQTTHLEKLEEERKGAAPTAISGGLSEGTPLVIKGTDGKEFRIVELRATENAAGGNSGKLDVVAAVEGTAGDAAAIRAQSEGAARALVAAYPELRTEFGGVLTSLVIAGQSPFVTAHPMGELR